MYRSCFVLSVCCASILTGFGLDLYETDFDAFPTGQGAWVGTEGWSTTGDSTDAFGISSTALPDLNNTAYIGFHQPPSPFNLVFRSFDFDPVATGHPIVRIETFLGVQDSTNGNRDQFFIGIRNRAGLFLGGIGFDNRDATGSGVNPITRLDGAGQFTTLETFDRNVLHLLFIEINFANNTWSAELDGLFPIFTDAPFSVNGNDMDLGFLSFEWQLSAGSVSQHGDNFLLVGDLFVEAVPISTTPLVLNIETDDSDRCLLSWVGEPGFQYELEFATEPFGAFHSVTEVKFTDIASVRTLSHLEEQPSVLRRFYRVRRSIQP